MIPEWVRDQVLAFGRLLGFTAFALDARGLAAVRFENGVRLRLEFVAPVMWVQALFAYPNQPEAMRRLLAEAHPARSLLPSGETGGCVRAAYMERSGEALLAIALDSEKVEASALDRAFRRVFEGAVRLGRAS